MTSPALPVIDLTRYRQSSDKAAFLAELRRVCREVGFFYLTGHGISHSAQQQILQLSRQFFALPASAKQQVQMLQSPHFRGYTALASEQTAGQADLREQFDIMREDTVLGLPTHNALWRRLIGPNQWPTALPALKPALLGVQQQFTAVLTELLHAMLESLQLDATALDHTIVDGPYQHLKIIRYPAIRQQNNNGQNSQAHSSSRQGVGAHKDPGYLTLVMQDEQPGLEVQTADGWLLVEPKPGALVVNIGELLELASNGYLKATVHRVTSPTQRDRYSCAFFMAAQLDATVPVLPLPAALAANAAGISTDPANPLLREVGANTLKGRLRSHRDVAAIHYPEWSQAS